MKTNNKRTMSKKDIRRILMTEDSTQIYRAYFQITGNRPSRIDVCDFIKEYAPNKSIARKAFSIAFSGINRHAGEYNGCHDFMNKNRLHNAIDELRRNISRGNDNYTKRPIMGRTHLYLASPVYGHGDYNKKILMRIEGNERFCELICRVADRYIPMASE